MGMQAASGGRPRGGKEQPSTTPRGPASQPQPLRQAVAWQGCHGGAWPHGWSQQPRPTQSPLCPLACPAGAPARWSSCLCHLRCSRNLCPRHQSSLAAATKVKFLNQSTGTHTLFDYNAGAGGNSH